MYPKLKVLALLIISATLVASCAPMVEEAVQPTHTTAPLQPTPTLIDKPIYFGEVTFKDNECTVEGPKEVERGIYYFSLINESDLNLGLYLNQLLDDKTLDDLLDWQEEPGVYRSAPPWIDHPRYSYSPELEKKIHYLDQIGNYAILLYSGSPTSLWFCFQFRVVAGSAD